VIYFSDVIKQRAVEHFPSKPSGDEIGYSASVNAGLAGQRDIGSHSLAYLGKFSPFVQ
jgi:hypothetical protein